MLLAAIYSRAQSSIESLLATVEVITCPFLTQSVHR